eukprot:1188693-Prorocentrum_minimum.AAC.11
MVTMKGGFLDEVPAGRAAEAKTGPLIGQNCPPNTAATTLEVLGTEPELSSSTIALSGERPNPSGCVATDAIDEKVKALP